MFDLTINATLTNFILSWRPPTELNGVVIEYEVCFNLSKPFICTNTSDTNHTLRDFPPDTDVTFSVRAYTIIGPGEYVTAEDSTDSIRKCSSSNITRSSNLLCIITLFLIHFLYSNC